MKVRYTLAFSLMLISFRVHAQKKIKEYYDNGNLKFEGKYTYTWKQNDFFEIRMQEMPKQDFRRRTSDELDEINKYLNFMPTKAYDGLCRFYYPGGEKLFEGNFVNGTPHGKFTYWHRNGKKSGELNFVNGMADGVWQLWEDNGNLISSFSYKAIPQDTLATLYKDFFVDNMRRNQEEHTGKDRIFGYLDRRETMRAIGNDMRINYSEELRPFRETIDQGLFKTSIWEGKFIVNEGGGPYLEFYFSNNKPSGIWKLWKNGQLYFECTFKDGKALTAKKYGIDEPDSYSNDAIEPEPVVVESASPDNTGSGKEVPPVREEDRVFTYVEQMPEFPGGIGGMKAYFEKNLIYPKEALENNIQGKSIVQIVVKEDGRIDTSQIKIQKSLGYGTDAEVKRLIKNMPVWKSGKQNGHPVPVVFTIPVLFEIKP